MVPDFEKFEDKKNENSRYLKSFHSFSKNSKFNILTMFQQICCFNERSPTTSQSVKYSRIYNHDSSV